MDESVDEHVGDHELCRLATHCHFGAYLAEALRDRVEK